MSRKKKRSPSRGNLAQRAPHAPTPKGFVAYEEQSFSGPMPHPDLLKGYDEVLPGAAERILAMAEGEATHRRNMSAWALRSAIRRSWGGLMSGLIVALAFLGVSGWLISDGHELAGSILGTVDLVALVTVFVIGRKTTGI